MYMMHIVYGWVSYPKVWPHTLVHIKFEVPLQRLLIKITYNQPCKMSVQCIGVRAVYWRMFSRLGGYHECHEECEGYHECNGGIP